MDDITLFLIVSLIFCTLMLLVGMIILKRRERQENQPDVQRPRGEPINRAVVDLPRRAGRNIRARMRAAASRPEEEEDDDQLADEIAMPEGKIGVKKRKKLELKAEKRIQRERELEEREERKQRQKELEDRRLQEEEKEQEEKAKQEEEEKALKEAQEKEELEEYLKLKETFAVEEEGFEEQENSEEAHKFNEFINYIKEQKVVLLEDLAAHFRMKTQDTIDRVQELLAQEWLNGVIDDRGKFIYITKEEMESVAQFVKQRGRVSIAELVECSNSLINLNPGKNESVSVKS